MGAPTACRIWDVTPAPAHRSVARFKSCVTVWPASTSRVASGASTMPRLTSSASQRYAQRMASSRAVVLHAEPSTPTTMLRTIGALLAPRRTAGSTSCSASVPVPRVRPRAGAGCQHSPHEGQQLLRRGKMRRLSRHHMLHTSRQVPLGHLGSGVHPYQKGALCGQWVGRVGSRLHRYLVLCLDLHMIPHMCGGVCDISSCCSRSTQAKI